MQLLNLETIDILRNEEGGRSFAGIYPHSPRRDLALLDLKMLEASLVHSGVESPQDVANCIDQLSLASNQPTGITYEELIYINPSRDARLFSYGEVAQTEYDFYEVHRLIEAHLENTLRGLTAARANLIGEGELDPYLCLQESIEHFSSVHALTQTIGISMPVKHFSTFRAYLGTHPTRNTKGPSGAFTGAIPQIEMAVLGGSTSDERLSYVKENLEYFPRDSRRALINQIKRVYNRTTLADTISAKGRDDLSESLEVLRKSLRVFRGHHYKAVKNQIPEALGGDLSGTAGENNPGEFLRNRIRTT